jgi:hypothetical protein
MHGVCSTSYKVCALISPFATTSPPDFKLQGTFAETGSPEDQLHWIFENAKTVRDADGVSCILEAVKIATKKHDFLW